MDIKSILGGMNPYVQSKVEKGEGSESSAKADKAKSRESSRTSSSGDRVSVSSDAKLVAEAAKAAQDSPGVRADRVEELRAQVQAGTYSPDPRRIAQKMVDNEVDFLR